MLKWLVALAAVCGAMQPRTKLEHCLDLEGKDGHQVAQELQRLGLTPAALHVDRTSEVNVGKFRSRHTTAHGHEVQVYAYDLSRGGIPEQFESNVKLIKALQLRAYYPYATACMRSAEVNYLVYLPTKQLTPLYHAIDGFDNQPWRSYFGQIAQIMAEIDEKDAVFAGITMGFLFREGKLYLNCEDIASIFPAEGRCYKSEWITHKKFYLRHFRDALEEGRTLPTRYVEKRAVAAWNSYLTFFFMHYYLCRAQAVCNNAYERMKVDALQISMEVITEHKPEEVARRYAWGNLVDFLEGKFGPLPARGGEAVTRTTLDSSGMPDRRAVRHEAAEAHHAHSAQSSPHSHRSAAPGHHSQRGHQSPTRHRSPRH